MNILQVAVLFAIALKCVTASKLTSNELEEGARMEQQPQVTGTVSTSSTVENGLVTLSQSQSSSSGQLVPRARNSDLNPYQELIERGNYEGIAKLGKMTRYKFVRNLCPLMTTVEHYNGLYRLMDNNKLIPCFIVYGNIKLVRKVISRDGVQQGHFLIDPDVENALVLSFHQENHGRFIGILTAREHHHIQSGRSGELEYDMVSISDFYDAIDPKKNMKFKHLLVSDGKRLNSEYPASYKFLCENLVFHFYFRKQDLTLKDFLGQPFPFPSDAIIDGFLFGYFSDSHLQRFLDVAPREAIERGMLVSDEYFRRRLWKNIVKRFSLTDSTFPPSRETLEDVLKRFPTKDDLEKAWSKENAHLFKGMIPKRSKEMIALISSLNLISDVLVTMVVDYIPKRLSWPDLEE
jgi:hypothetical protein